MSTTTDSVDLIRIAFMCIQNAGRSQMSTAFAERERARRGLDDQIRILTGGTHPADHVHEEVIEVMDEAGVDLSDRTPREITIDELQSYDYVATMGCSTLDVDEVGVMSMCATGRWTILMERIWSESARSVMRLKDASRRCSSRSKRDRSNMLDSADMIQ